MASKEGTEARVVFCGDAAEDGGEVGGGDVFRGGRGSDGLWGKRGRRRGRGFAFWGHVWRAGISACGMGWGKERALSKTGLV